MVVVVVEVASSRWSTAADRSVRCVQSGVPGWVRTHRAVVDRPGDEQVLAPACSARRNARRWARRGCSRPPASASFAWTFAALTSSGVVVGGGGGRLAVVGGSVVGGTVVGAAVVGATVVGGGAAVVGRRRHRGRRRDHGDGGWRHGDGGDRRLRGRRERRRASSWWSRQRSSSTAAGWESPRCRSTSRRRAARGTRSRPITHSASTAPATIARRGDVLGARLLTA